MAIVCGCKPSKIDASDKKITKPIVSKIPAKYDFKNALMPIQNQGQTNMCVTYAISSYLNWVADMKHKTPKKNNNVDLKELYNARADKKHDNGMSIKEALLYLKTHGVKSGIGNMKINGYGIIGSTSIAKQAIFANGPIVIALPVYDDSKYDNFWDGSNLVGYHAVALVGYDEKGFILRNSWGTSYARQGYSYLSDADFMDKALECWTII